MTKLGEFFSTIKQRILNLITALNQSIKDQIVEYKSGVIIQRRKTKTRTILATGLYLFSMLALVPSIIHLLMDSLVHIPAMATSVGLYRLHLVV